MNQPFALLVAVIEAGCALGQYMRTTGRAKLEFWPFFQTETKAGGLAATGAFAAMTAVLLAIAIWG